MLDLTTSESNALHMLVSAANVAHGDQRANSGAPRDSSWIGDSECSQEQSLEHTAPIAPPLPQLSPAHRCRICQRTYERADHLTRHFRSHTNARPFQCQQCPKSFNRVDLLNRHVITHARNASSSSNRAEIRRTERAGQACVACAAAKVRCEDQKPCRRCRSKNISCKTSASQTSKRVTVASEDQLIHHSDQPSGATLPPSMRLPNILNAHDADDNADTEHTRPSGSDLPSTALHTTPAIENDMARPEHNFPAPTEPYILPLANSNGISSPQFYPPANVDLLNGVIFYPGLMDFNNQNLDFGFQYLDFQDDLLIADNFLPSTTTTDETLAVESTRNAPSTRDVARGHAAFTRSPWLWTPAPKDHFLSDKDNLALDERTIPSTLTPSSSSSVANVPSCGFPSITSGLRDSMFFLLSTIKGFNTGIPKFPSLDVLNHIMEAYFLRQSYQVDTWIHIPTISSVDVIPEFLIALIAAGSTVIAVPEIWKMGLALLDVVRKTTGDLWERENSSTRKLQPLQAWMLSLNTGLWSGFQRQMELAESFCQPLVTMMRRGGIITASPDTQALIPNEDDVGKALDIKWKQWATRESFKRLTLQLFLHDSRASIALQKNPLMSFTEISSSVPASGTLFLAGTAEEWKMKYNEQHAAAPHPLPRLSDVRSDPSILDDFGGGADLELCYTVLLYGFWGQIWAFRQSSKFHNTDIGDSVHRLWLTAQQRELYREIEEFRDKLLTMPTQQAALIITAELFLMILHVSPDDLQQFAGKAGEEAASHALSTMERWSTTESSRRAVWHAGQIFYWASLMPPAELRDFYTIAVYFGSLTMWTYGHLAPSHSQDSSRQSKVATQPPESSKEVPLAVLNGPECRQTRAFILKGQGMPVLAALKSWQSENREESFVMLGDPNEVLQMARNLYRRNFPVHEEPLPPLVENIGNLMRDLRTLPESRFSRCVSPAER